MKEKLKEKEGEKEKEKEEEKDLVYICKYGFYCPIIC